MKRVSLFLGLLLVLSNMIFAQSIDRSVICSGGQTDKNSTYTVEWTLGDLEVGGTLVTQGFNQAFKLITTVEQQVENPAIKVFPNPVQTNLTISVEENISYDVFLTDIYGRKLQQIFLSFSENVFDISSYPNGFYFLIFTKASSKQSFKILKNN